MGDFRICIWEKNTCLINRFKTIYKVITDSDRKVFTTLSQRPFIPIKWCLTDNGTMDTAFTSSYPNEAMVGRHIDTEAFKTASVF
jgi:hypothetical protein